jgi:hypothetical protein
VSTELCHIPQFIVCLHDTRYALYVKSIDKDPAFDLMFWLENWYCETFGVSKPTYVSKAAAQLSLDRMNGVRTKKTSGPRTDWERNILWMIRVERWRCKLQTDGPKEACEKVSEELKKEGKSFSWTTIRSGCERAKQRFVLRFADYDECPSLGICTPSVDAPLILPSTYSLPTFCDEPPTPVNFRP